jgi:hypothetical protein
MFKFVIKTKINNSPSGNIKSGQIRDISLYPKNTYGLLSLRNFLYILVETEEDLRQTMRRTVTDPVTGLSNSFWVGNMSLQHLGDWTKGINFGAIRNPDRAVQPWLRASDCAKDFDGKASPLNTKDPVKLSRYKGFKNRKPNHLFSESDFECACDDAGSENEFFLNLDDNPFRLISVGGKFRHAERMVR